MQKFLLNKRFSLVLCVLLIYEQNNISSDTLQHPIDNGELNYPWETKGHGILIVEQNHNEGSNFGSITHLRENKENLEDIIKRLDEYFNFYPPKKRYYIETKD